MLSLFGMCAEHESRGFTAPRDSFLFSTDQSCDFSASSQQAPQTRCGDESPKKGGPPHTPRPPHRTQCIPQREQR